MQKISFKNQAGLMLRGYLDPSGSGKAVILCHGFTGDKSEFGKFDKMARMLHTKGLGVLRFDFRGCGESDDSPINISGEVEDLYSGIEYMESKGYKRIGLLGYSLGGLVVLKVRKSCVKTLVLWAPLTGPRRDVRSGYSFWQMLQLAIRGKMKIKKERKWRNEMVVSRAFLFETGRIDQAGLLNGVDLPVLIIHGDSDEKIPTEFSKSAIGKLSGKSRLEIIQGADHHFNGHAEELVGLSSRWFMGNL